MRITGATLECIHCGETMTLGDKESSRSFMLVYKKFLRKHDWHCEANAKAAKKIEKVKSVVNDAIAKAMKG